MLAIVLRNGATTHLCGTCMKARGVAKRDLIDGAEVGSMSSLAQWTLAANTLAADKVINH